MHATSVQKYFQQRKAKEVSCFQLHAKLAAETSEKVTGKMSKAAVVVK